MSYYALPKTDYSFQITQDHNIDTKEIMFIFLLHGKVKHPQSLPSHRPFLLKFDKKLMQYKELIRGMKEICVGL